jgi:hypothetical protein
MASQTLSQNLSVLALGADLRDLSATSSLNMLWPPFEAAGPATRVPMHRMNARRAPRCVLQPLRDYG